MRTIRLFADQPLSVGQSTPLSPATQRHVATVLRRPAGAEVVLFNGDGHEYIARLENHPDGTLLASITTRQACLCEPTQPLTLAIAVIKNDRMDWAVQKATELGVTRIIPLLTERSVVRPSASQAQKRLQRWQQVGRSACEQSGRCVPPTIEPITTLEALQSDPNWALFDPRAERSLAQLVAASPVTGLLIGPEGGLTANEVAQLTQPGLRAARFGKRTLRAETAAISGLTALQWQAGELS